MSQPANNYGSLHTFLAGGAITANRAVKLSAAGTVVHTTASAEDVIGIATQTVASGAYVEVFCLNGGKHKVGTAAAVTAGNQVMPNSADGGLCIAASGASAKSFGIATTTSSGTSGEVVEVLLRFGVNGPANT